jgi:hypothetical protein
VTGKMAKRCTMPLPIHTPSLTSRKAWCFPALCISAHPCFSHLGQSLVVHGTCRGRVQGQVELVLPAGGVGGGEGRG